MRHLLLPALLLSALPALPGAAQALDATFTPPSSVYTTGGIYALGPQQADGKRVLAGIFTRVGGQNTGNVARIDNAGTLDQTFAQNVGVASNVYRVVAGLNGQYLLGAWGGDVVAGGLTRAEVLRLNADGTADASFNAGTGPRLGTSLGYGQDYAVQPDGKVLVGGVFSSYSGAAAPGLVRLSSTGARDQAFITNLGTGINCANGDELRSLTVLPSGKILVGGVFASFNGQAAPGLVRLNADGTYDATFTAGLPAGSGVVAMLVQPDGNLLLHYRLAGNTTGTNLLRLLPSGAVDATFACTYSIDTSYQYGIDPMMALQADGRIVVVGSGYSQSTGGSYLARLTSTGALDPSFQPSDTPGALQVTVGIQPDGSLLVAAPWNYTNYGSLDATIARYNSAGVLQPGFAPKVQATGSVRALLRLADGSLVAGGDFSEWNGQSVHHLVHLSSTGVYDAAFTANTSASTNIVNQLALQPDGRLLVAGYYRLQRLLASGASDATFATFQRTVIGLALQPDGKMLVVGPFLNVGWGMARLNGNGSQDNTYVGQYPNLGGGAGLPNVLALQPDGKVVLAQQLSPTSGDASYVYRQNSTGSLDNTFTPTPFAGGLVNSLLVQPDGNILVGGGFTTVNGTAQKGLGRLNPNGSVDAGFAPGTAITGTVSTLALQPNGRVLLGGSFSSAGGFARLGRVLANGQPDLSFSPGNIAPNASVSSLLVQPDGGIIAGGYFTALGNQSIHNLARITAPNVLAVQAPAAVAAATTAWPVPTHERLHVQPAATAHPRQAELLDALGRVVQQRILPGAAEFSLDVSGLPAGLYVLRLHYQEGTVTRPISVE